MGVEQILLIAIALIGTVLGIRIVANLNIDLSKLISDWRTERRFKKCRHFEVTPLKDGSAHVQSLFTSPPGTVYWVCIKCGGWATEAAVNYAYESELKHVAKVYAELGINDVSFRQLN